MPNLKRQRRNQRQKTIADIPKNIWEAEDRARTLTDEKINHELSVQGEISQDLPSKWAALVIFHAAIGERDRRIRERSQAQRQQQPEPQKKSKVLHMNRSKEAHARKI